jgi:predicted ATPase/transcriptional regulator with XRE-family HTH domain
MNSERSFGGWLRQRRRVLDLTQEELAHQVGCSAITLRKLEAELRRPSEQIAARLADILGIALTERAAFVRFAQGDPFSAPRSARAEQPDAGPTDNLPHPLTSFIGREQQKSEVRSRLSPPAGARLLTLWGVGGSGKTRLAIQVASDLGPQYADGVRWVELAPLADPALVPQAFIGALGVRPAWRKSEFESLAGFLKPRELLLVVDNCEHLLGACAQLVDSLLARCPRLTVLATSREPLHLNGESVFSVPPLATPTLAELSPARVALEYDSVALFVERARATRRDLVWDDQAALAVVQICSRLDGIPLALELAAARCSTLSVYEIAALLDDRFGLLTHGSRMAMPRQQTLRGALDWSYDLLAEAEQTLLARLSVFAGGFTWPAVQAVCLGTGAEALAVLEHLSPLVEKSLVVSEAHGTETRYHLLETIRTYALEKLSALGQADAAQSRHFDYCLGLARQANAAWATPQERASLDRLQQEHDNLRAAFAWAMERGQLEAALELTISLSPFWHHRHNTREGSQWFHRVLASGPLPALPRGRALAISGQTAINLGQPEQAAGLLNEALALAMSVGDMPTRGVTLTGLGMLALFEGNYVQAVAHLQEAVVVRTAAGDSWQVGIAQLWLAEALWRHGQTQAAWALWEQTLRYFQGRGGQVHIGWALGSMGHAAFLERRLERALEHTLASLTIKRAIDDQDGTAGSLNTLAGIAALNGQLVRAACLWGAASNLREINGLRSSPSIEGDFAALMAETRAALGDRSFESAWHEGRALQFESAIDYALAFDVPAK